MPVDNTAFWHGRGPIWVPVTLDLTTKGRTLHRSRLALWRERCRFLPVNVWPGRSYPLGAAWDGTGVNFALFSEVAERVELCLFDSEGREQRIDLNETTAFIWHGYVPNLWPGQHYGYRVHGPWDPSRGLRCNPNNLLLDPYATAVDGEVRWNGSLFSHLHDHPDLLNPADSAAVMPKSVVTNPWFDWQDDRHPNTPWHETVVYEVHVKGFTHLHPSIPPDLRGTYAAIGRPECIRYLKSLGVTAVELLPIHQFIHDERLFGMGLRNYWGYNSICYLAPHGAYSSSGEGGQQVTEFKKMVKNLHQAGIEVILDVVYNHTAEGNHLGPSLAMKGIDNPAYYRLDADQRFYTDYTGTGNSMNMQHPNVLQLIMDSLRYWVKEMHVDGFRFDLASTLARELHDVDRLSAFFDIIQQDPVISRTKLIAEPWDVGEGGYQVGNFPPLWSEWNGKYRDWVRDYWRGNPQSLAELGYRLTGSSDLYGGGIGRLPSASINFVTCHDGFTLADLVSYNHKHNLANGEHNHDGTDDDRSWNHGSEGPTDDPAINQLRRRQQKNLLATLMLSQGVPMLLGGDEFGRTQKGNNNGYCQDNEISWFDWSLLDTNAELVEFTRRVAQIRAQHPVFRRRRWFSGRAVHDENFEDRTGELDLRRLRGQAVEPDEAQPAQLPDIAWFEPGGLSMTAHDWRAGFAKSISVFLNGDALPDPDERGERIVDDSFLLLLNASELEIDFRVPDGHFCAHWVLELDTSATGMPMPEVVGGGTTRRLMNRSLQLLRRLD